MHFYRLQKKNFLVKVWVSFLMIIDSQKMEMEMDLLPMKSERRIDDSCCYAFCNDFLMIIIHMYSILPEQMLFFDQWLSKSYSMAFADNLSVAVEHVCFKMSRETGWWTSKENDVTLVGLLFQFCNDLFLQSADSSKRLMVPDIVCQSGNHDDGISVVVIPHLIKSPL